MHSDMHNGSRNVESGPGKMLMVLNDMWELRTVCSEAFRALDEKCSTTGTDANHAMQVRQNPDPEFRV